MLPILIEPPNAHLRNDQHKEVVAFLIGVLRFNHTTHNFHRTNTLKEV